MKHLKKFESSDWKVITYEEYLEMTYTEEFTKRELKEITDFLIKECEAVISSQSHQRIYFKNSRQYVIYKYDDDWFIVKSLNGTEIWKCDQMYGLKELLKKITERYREII
jgi:hypothetical protein